MKFGELNTEHGAYKFNRDIKAVCTYECLRNAWLDPLAENTGSSESCYLDQSVGDRVVDDEAADRNLLTGLG